MAASPSKSTPQPPSLPEGLSADSIDTLPVLSAILSRLQNPSPSAPISAGSASASPQAATATAAGGTPSQLASSGSPALALRDIPTATDELKHRLQKARAQVKELPDIERTVAEQEAEMKELELRISRQREVLLGLKNVGLNAKRDMGREGGGQPMEGIES